MSRKLLYLCVILVIMLYTQHYMKYNKDIKIIQSYLDTMSPNVLFEKYPVVIYDRIVEPNELRNTLFAYLHTHARYINYSPNAEMTLNTSKYMIIYSPDKNVTLQIASPKYKSQLSFQRQNGFLVSKDMKNSNVQYVTMKLKKQQVLILPTFWMFQSEVNLRVIVLDDPMSMIVKGMYYVFS